MADFEKAIPHILKWEGGYVNHPKDPGGETKYGITDRLDGKVDGMVDLDGDGIGDVSVKGLTVDQAKALYKRLFWNRMKGDLILNQQVADLIFDGYVNMGVNGLKVAQRAAKVVDDGKFGPATITAINKSNAYVLYKDIKSYRVIFYTDLVKRKPDMAVFLKGWMNRVNGFVFKP